GMSGVVYGLLGFAWVAPLLQPAWKIQPSQPIMLFMVGWLIFCMTGFTEIIGFGAIANAAHLGGLICGAILGGIFGLASGRDKA
ncbi:MAG: rhomboid family intramembrane serine protease, partial [Pseudomonadota bacterium]